MHKNNDKNVLRGRLLAVSFAALLAGVGACTTNQMPGNGQPTNPGPYGTTTPSSTPGSSSGTEGTKPSAWIVAPQAITPMYSSSTEAAGVLAGHNGRYLGPLDPGPASASYGVDIVTGQVGPDLVNPEQTVNSSISSAPTTVITSGGGGGGAAILGGVSAAAPINAALTAGVNTTSAAAALTAAATNGTAITANAPTAVAAAPIFTTPSTVATPANTAIPATAGSFAAGPGLTATQTTAPVVATTPTVTSVGAATTNVIANQNTGLLTPTVSSSMTPSPTLAANPPVGNVRTVTTTAPVTTVTSPSSSSTSRPVAIGTGVIPRPVRLPGVTATTPVTSPVVTAPAVSAARTRTRAVASTTKGGVVAPSTLNSRRARPIRVTTSGSNVTITNQ